MKLLVLTVLFVKCIFIQMAFATNAAAYFYQNDTLPVRGFSIAAPQPSELNDFIKFIGDELAPRNINTLILLVDFNYQFERHPELREGSYLSKSEVKKVVAACRRSNIRIIPQINLLGHQSWAGKTTKLLEVYPQFDETPWVKMPDKYEWPNKDGLYCKSYCPLHPGVHKIVFDLMDEICTVFETDAFHAGMDEVFYIGDGRCSRCSGHDPAKLFAGEVTKIRDYLALTDRRLWIWGDRLIDGKTTGLGEWEASMNNTHRAIDMIPKDVIICDWHYERADQTAIYFAMKGLSVVSCPWKNPQTALLQSADMYTFRQRSTPEMKGRFLGIVLTAWSGAGSFLKEFYASDNQKNSDQNTVPNTLKALFTKLEEPEPKKIKTGD